MRAYAIALSLIALTAHIAGAENPDSVRIDVPEKAPAPSGTPVTAPDTEMDGTPIPVGAVGTAPQWSPAAFIPAPSPVPVWQQRIALPGVTFLPGVAPITAWRGGGIYATGGRSSSPGLMGLETGRLNFSQNFGRLNITAYGDATKIGYFRGLSTQWGFGGALTYTFSPTVSLTLYGSYYSPASGIANPGIREVMPIGSFGGYVDWRFAGRWGVKAGATARQSILSNRYEVRPMVMPYFHLAPGADIGMDVGGILYELLRSKSSYGPRNPTVGPMKPGPPPVGPRD